jgi:hypothetical protein
MSGITVYIRGLRRWESPPAFRSQKGPNDACGKQNVALVTKIPAAPSATSAAETNFQPRRGHRLLLGTQNRLIRAKCAVIAAVGYQRSTESGKKVYC